MLCSVDSTAELDLYPLDICIDVEFVNEILMSAMLSKSPSVDIEESTPSPGAELPKLKFAVKVHDARVIMHAVTNTRRCILDLAYVENNSPCSDLLVLHLSSCELECSNGKGVGSMAICLFSGLWATRPEITDSVSLPLELYAMTLTKMPVHLIRTGSTV